MIQAPQCLPQGRTPAPKSPNSSAPSHATNSPVLGRGWPVSWSSGSWPTPRLGPQSSETVSHLSAASGPQEAHTHSKQLWDEAGAPEDKLMRP